MIIAKGRKILLCATLALAATACQMQGVLASQLRVPLPERSAGVFIGVGTFSHDFSLSDVCGAVNDAVDLAYALSIERHVLPANRVLLLLAGEPAGGSRDRLARLLAAGASRGPARQADVYTMVEEQSKLVGEAGILVLQISTHGFSGGGDHHLLAEDSLLAYGTGVTAANLLQATQAGQQGQKLLLIDACREQLVKPAWRGPGTAPDGRSAMRTDSLERLSRRPGYAVFSAASEGEYGWCAGGNGLFTRAIVNGLRCRQGERVKTLTALASQVRDEVIALSPGHRQHPELTIGGETGDLALLRCGGREPSPPAPVSPPLPPDLLWKLRTAGNLLAVGGLENVERSFQLYREVFPQLPADALATLNQGLLARAQQLDDGSRRDEGARIYRQLLEPLVERPRAAHPDP